MVESLLTLNQFEISDSFKSLFIKNSKYVDRINEVIKKNLEEQKIEFPEDYQKSDYDFFLTDKEIVIINIFDFHAMQSVQANISYASIKDILDKADIEY